jgi:predicted acyl esterase
MPDGVRLAATLYMPGWRQAEREVSCPDGISSYRKGRLHGRAVIRFTRFARRGYVSVRWTSGDSGPVKACRRTASIPSVSS